MKDPWRTHATCLCVRVQSLLHVAQLDKRVCVGVLGMGVCHAQQTKQPRVAATAAAVAVARISQRSDERTQGVAMTDELTWDDQRFRLSC